jgi:hypothetical protein
MTGVYLDTRSYRAAHGHAPRGTGDWAFSLDGQGPLWVVHVPFAEARAEAFRRARMAGASTVRVLP